VQAVLFDYTLVDASPAIIECANHALREMGLAPRSPQAIRRTIGPLEKIGVPAALAEAELSGARVGCQKRSKAGKLDVLIVDGTGTLDGKTHRFRAGFFARGKRVFEAVFSFEDRPSVRTARLATIESILSSIRK
jgi:hypothetical protein